MTTRPRKRRTALRRAVWASVALHIAAAGGFVLLVRQNAPRVAARQALTDTRAPDVTVRFAEGPAAEIQLPPAPTPAPAAFPPDVPPTPPPPVPPAEPLATGPFAPRAPQTLPPELLARIRTFGPTIDPHVRPVGASGPPGAAGPVHGPLTPGQTIVYVLDASGSMGAGGKFDAARAALSATLAAQPAGVRFQVVVYDGAARPLLPSDGAALPATPDTAARAAARLAALAPRGRSNHLAAVRAALDFRPDVLVLLTDADDLTAAALAPALAGAARPPVVCVALVGASGVQPPRALK